MKTPRLFSGATAALVMACGTAGSSWMAEPLSADDQKAVAGEPPPAEPGAPKARSIDMTQTRIIGADEPRQASDNTPADAVPTRIAASGGRSLGTFRNTYYDFPNESDFEGGKVPLKNARCEIIGQVPKGFFESVCVQGSGTLRQGGTVSFAKRDCACAEVCPRTEQRICFDLLDARTYPWGRGATGKAITPLVTVAVDSDVLALGTPIYVPELDGLPRDESGGGAHDGCFVAQDRGIRVKGKHIDVFTGHASVTLLWNRLVPSNQGVTVIVDSPRCPRRG
jgi:3D (Asp-Asp-Asp) domain-containing protein